LSAGQDHGGRERSPAVQVRPEQVRPKR
jgi:hypothetical protein